MEREQALWEWAKEQQDPASLARIAAARTQCRVTTPGANYQEKLAELAQAQTRTEQSVSVDVVRFGCEHLRVLSRSSKDARKRMLASWRADVLADPITATTPCCPVSPDGSPTAATRLRERASATGETRCTI